MKIKIRNLAKKIIPHPLWRMLARTWAFPRSLPSRLFVEMRARRILRYLDSTRGRGNIVIFGTPEHGNIGDHAIVLAEREFFKKHFPGRTVVEIPQGLDRPVAARLGAVHGGGFLGNLWLPANYVQKNYLENFPNRRIVLFPNTIFFEEKGGWRREIAETRAAYRAHGDLHVFIRDKSIDFLKKEILGEDSPRAHGAPDIVLSLDRSAPKFERAGVLLCFRADKEKVLPDAAVAELEARLRERGERASRTDTVVPYAVPAEVREFEVERKFDEFRRARLVITDRLHGMIFAAITGTPCIALNNSSGKVEGVWSLWLRHLDYVKFVREAAGLREVRARGGGNPRAARRDARVGRTPLRPVRLRKILGGHRRDPARERNGRVRVPLARRSRGNVFSPADSANFSTSAKRAAPRELSEKH